MPVGPFRTLYTTILLASLATAALSQAKPTAHAPFESADSSAIEMFEKKIRPVLAQNCFECHSHSANKSLGGIFLDSRAGILQGGKRGTGLVPGHPDKSLLI